MVTKEELLLLKTKLLPSGAEQIVDFLASRHHSVEITQIVLENVPLLILGRHGMIARIPINGDIRKVSQPDDILQLLHTFFQKQEKLYLFINLPDLPVPLEVAQVLQEAEQRAALKEQLLLEIDHALDTGNRALFMELSKELQQLEIPKTVPAGRRRRYDFPDDQAGAADGSR